MDEQHKSEPRFDWGYRRASAWHEEHQIKRRPGGRFEKCIAITLILFAIGIYVSLWFWPF
jgi:hypothetical protein